MKYFLYATLILLFIGCQEDDGILIKSDDLRENILGEWHCLETHEEDGEQDYWIEIEKDEDNENKIIINNFLGLSSDLNNPKFVKAEINENMNAFFIFEQKIGTHTTSGDGEISDDYEKITLTYKDDIYSDGDVKNVTAIYTRNVSISKNN